MPHFDFADRPITVFGCVTRKLRDTEPDANYDSATFVPKIGDAWLGHVNGIAWRKGFAVVGTSTIEITYTHLWPANRCTECEADLTGQAGFQRRLIDLTMNLPKEMINELTQGRSNDALWAGLLTMKNQAVQAVGDANQARAEAHAAGQALNSYADAAEERDDALMTSNAWNRHCFKRAYVEAEIMHDGLEYACRKIGQKRQNSGQCMQSPPPNLSSVITLSCHRDDSSDSEIT